MKKKLQVKIFSESKHQLPTYATSQSAGMDLRANIEGTVVLNPGERTLIPTGLHIQLPDGYEAQIRPRSGLAIKQGVTCNFGTIDADYRGNIGVILFNLSDKPFEIHDGDRIAQMVIAKYEKVAWDNVLFIEALEKTKRGENGFGHSGMK